MKKFYIILFALLVSFGCKKEQVLSSIGEHEFCIEATLPELEPAFPDTKATISTSLKLKWADGDALSIINVTTGKALGGNLIANLEGDKTLFKGTLNGAISVGDVLIAIYPAKGYATETAVSSISIDFSSQTVSSLSKVPFCAYQQFTCKETGVINISSSFNLASSYFQCGLSLPEHSVAINSVSVPSMGSKVNFSFNDGGINIGSETGTITVNTNGISLNKNGNAFVYLGTAPVASATRNATISTPSNSYKAPFSSSALSKSKYYTTIATAAEIISGPEFKSYIDEYGINHGAGIKYNGVIWAPVNCGYHATSFPKGKFYQWGRKDGGYNTTVSSTVSSPSAANASTYYNGTQDWLSPQNDKLWNSGTETAPIKTQYDPCPDGWRVPTKTEMDKLASCSYLKGTLWRGETQGSVGAVIFATSSFSRIVFPGTGSYGSSSNATYVYSWTSTVSSTNAYYLKVSGYSTSSTSSVVSGTRKYGYTIRCVQI